MKFVNLLKIIFFIGISLNSHFLNPQEAWAQEARTQEALNKDTINIEKTVNLDKAQKQNSPSEGNKIKGFVNSFKNILGDIFTSKQIKSTMYNDVEYKNIEKALEAFKSNQEFSLEDSNKNPESEPLKEGEEATKKEAKAEIEENIKSYIYLSSIMFFSKNNWTLWIDNKKFQSSTNSELNELYFENVYQDKVDILWKISISKWKILSGKKSEELAPKINDLNQVEVRFSLKPNQTFMLGSNQVVDGRAQDFYKK